ncbi:MAG: hypothetical protein QW776_00485 [Candidatus Nitrosocaldus sp.]
MAQGDVIAGSSTAWGSWMLAANPVLRDVYEYILVLRIRLRGEQW